MFLSQSDMNSDRNDVRQVLTGHRKYHNTSNIIKSQIDGERTMSAQMKTIDALSHMKQPKMGE